MTKIVTTAAAATSDIGNGATIAVGGFGLCGIPSTLVEALRDTGAEDLSIVSNNCGVDDWGLGILLKLGRIARLTCSYLGEHRELERRFLSGELEVELVAQGTLAERLRAGGSGIPAFYTPAGVGTLVANGGLPRRYGADGSVTVSSPPKELRGFGGQWYLLEEAIVTDFALVHAAVADTEGNLVFHSSARNFNPLCAMAARVTIVEAEHVVDAGELDPDAIHLPGVFVQRVVQSRVSEKRIERRTVRPRGST